ncbi:hypothetical protein [Dongia sp.]|uniref:hypothetical protein n=1 Tax=Dongia sp. TaxID=1977262 RepID=UPI0035B13A7A
MKRRTLLQCLLTAATLGASGRAALADVPPAPFFVWARRFYRAQLTARALREGRATAAETAGFDATLGHPLRHYLTDEMQRLFDQAAAKPLPSDTPEGPILDFVFGWGALPNREIELVSVTEAPWWQGLVTKNLALVTISINGNERDLTLKGEYVPELFTWRIADIDYGEGSGESLRERLERHGN